MIYLKRGDTGIGIKATLTNENGNVDLTDANVLFLFNGDQINAGMNDETSGQVFVTFDKRHTEKTGIFDAEFEVTFSDGRVETYPNDDYLKIHILEDLGGK